MTSPPLGFFLDAHYKHRVAWRFLLLFVVLSSLLFTACSPQMPWNNPYTADEVASNTLFSAFTNRPKHLDPVQSYAENEITFTAQIYEPPLQYHYLKRPYTLQPNTLTQMPEVRFFAADGSELPADATADQVAESHYTLSLQKGILFQPHPAFALTEQGEPLYVGAETAQGRLRMADFPQHASRELTAHDYVYEIKRLAHPRLHSPIFSIMRERIIGLPELAAALKKANQDKQGQGWIDLDQFPLAGVEVLDKYRWKIRIRGKYPQFFYWLAMPFFAPVAREVDRFFAQPGMSENNLTLDWWPVGTGPYYLSENDPNRRMTLTRNPNFRRQTYPCEGDDGDREAGLLNDCGQTLPLIERAIFTREKEAIPYWNRFLQGYYDASGISSDSFDQAVKIDLGGSPEVSPLFAAKGIGLHTTVQPSTFYYGFNMLDPVVGGLGEAQSKLRQAISIAIDQEEMIAIFNNGRGVAAHSPIPPGLFGYLTGEAGINPYVYDWKNGRAVRKSVAEAKKLLAEAGYPNGRHHQSGEALILYLDSTATSMGDKSRLDWLVRQLAKIDIQLVVRSSDFNRFQDKLRQGAIQIFFLGWIADYPDPENFLFLLDSQASEVKHQGDNHANYENPEFDRLFRTMRSMDNTPERLSLIKKIMRLLQHDAPWVFSMHPKDFVLTHAWLKNRKPAAMINNNLKYQRLDAAARVAAQRRWNSPVLWPLAGLGLVFAVLLIWPIRAWRQRQRQRAF